MTWSAAASPAKTPCSGVSCHGGWFLLIQKLEFESVLGDGQSEKTALIEGYSLGACNMLGIHGGTLPSLQQTKGMAAG